MNFPLMLNEGDFMTKLLNIIEEEKYIQINDMTAQELVETWSQLVTNYRGYDVFFSYNNERMAVGQVVPTAELAEIGAELVDDMFAFKLRFDNLKLITKTTADVILLDETNFAEFAEFHDARHPSMYWTSARIKDRLDLWQIHILKTDGRIAGYVMTMMAPTMAEVFVVVAEDETSFKNLLIASCNQVFSMDKKEILYMIDKTDVVKQSYVLELGFEKTGFYQGFRVKL